MRVGGAEADAGGEAASVGEEDEGDAEEEEGEGEEEGVPALLEEGVEGVRHSRVGASIPSRLEKTTVAGIGMANGSGHG